MKAGILLAGLCCLVLSAAGAEKASPAAEADVPEDVRIVLIRVKDIFTVPPLLPYLLPRTQAMWGAIEPSKAGAELSARVAASIAAMPTVAEYGALVAHAREAREKGGKASFLGDALDWDPDKTWCVSGNPSCVYEKEIEGPPRGAFVFSKDTASEDRSFKAGDLVPLFILKGLRAPEAAAAVPAKAASAAQAASSTGFDGARGQAAAGRPGGRQDSGAPPRGTQSSTTAPAPPSEEPVRRRDPDPRLEKLREGEAALVAIAGAGEPGEALASFRRRLHASEAVDALAAWVSAQEKGPAGSGPEKESLMRELAAVRKLDSVEGLPRLLALQKRLEALMDASATGRAEKETGEALSELQRQAAQLQVQLAAELQSRPFFARLQALSGREPGALSEAERQELASYMEDPVFTRHGEAGRVLQARIADEGQRLAELARRNPGYFEARALAGKSVQYVRGNLAQFKDGTEFSADEIGFPPGKAVGNTVKKITWGDAKAAALSYQGEDRLTHIETLPNPKDPSQRLTADEVVDKATGRHSFVEHLFRDGKVSMAIYDDKGQAQWPKTTGVFDERGELVTERLEFADGSSEAPMADAPEIWLMKSKTGQPMKWSFNLGTFARVADAWERGQRIEQAVRKVLSGRFPEGAALKEHSDAIKCLLLDVTRSPAEGDIRVELPAGKLKVVISAKGAAVTAQWVALPEEPWTGLPLSRAETKTGLGVYKRNASSLDDPVAEFSRTAMYLGGWGMETFKASIDSNTDRWYWWLRGPKVTEQQETCRVHFGSMRADGSSAYDDSKKLCTRVSAKLYDGPGIIGAAGEAIGTIGKGVVNLTGAAVSAGLATSPAYLLLVKAAGGDAHAAQRDLFDRAKVNFFNNAVSAQLGGTFGGERYRAGVKSLELNAKHDVQNVGQEMADLGHAEAGAVLQGGVSFANSAVPMLGYMKGLRVIGELGKAGKLASAGFGAYMTWEGGKAFGGAVREFGEAMADYRYRDYDPASKARYYAAIANLTEQGLNLPMLFGGLKDVYGKPGAVGSKGGEPAAGRPVGAAAPEGASRAKRATAWLREQLLGPESTRIYDSAENRPTADELLAHALRVAQGRGAAGGKVAGALSSGANPTQSLSDCGERAKYHNPALRVVRDAGIFKSYDQFLDYVEWVVGRNRYPNRLRDKGTMVHEERAILESLGFELDSYAQPRSEADLARLIETSGGQLDAHIRWRQPDGAIAFKDAGHAAVLNLYVSEKGRSWFVMTDSNSRTPRVYSYKELQALDLKVAAVRRAIDPATSKPLNDLQVLEKAAGSWNRFVDAHWKPATDLVRPGRPMKYVYSVHGFPLEIRLGMIDFTLARKSGAVELTPSAGRWPARTIEPGGEIVVGSDSSAQLNIPANLLGGKSFKIEVFKNSVQVTALTVKGVHVLYDRWVGPGQPLHRAGVSAVRPAVYAPAGAGPR